MFELLAQVDPVGVAKELGDAQSVQQVLAVVVLVFLTLWGITTKVLWTKYQESNNARLADLEEERDFFRSMTSSGLGDSHEE